MGAEVIRVVEREPGMSIVAALERPDHPRLGEEIRAAVRLASDPRPALAGADVVIDFSRPEATLRILPVACERGVPAVVGTTGFSGEERARLEEWAKRLPVVAAPNFSMGANLLTELAAEVARRLRGYDAEILELHHAGKADAPSGTALRIAEAIAEARRIDLAEHGVLHREGRTGPRPPEAIGIQSLRAGDAVGEHTVYFAGPGERLELTHRVLSRENFAAGAVRAARWVIGRPPGLYSMRDVLG
jgi:4-hydroxy-tetrahydrodipicolinate reductase